jgi:hypothetical protein
MTQTLLEIAQNTPKHKKPRNILRTYEQYFLPLRDRSICILEIGVKFGGSLQIWKKYFQKGNVYGIDNKKLSCRQGRSRRIQCFCGSQSNIKFLETVIDRIRRKLTIIVDDGSHRMSDQITSFDYLFPYLIGGGYYIIEDIGTSTRPHWGGCRQPLSQTTTIDHLLYTTNKIYWPNYGELAQIPPIEFVHFYPRCVVIKKSGRTT